MASVQGLPGAVGLLERPSQVAAQQLKDFAKWAEELKISDVRLDTPVELKTQAQTAYDARAAAPWALAPGAVPVSGGMGRAAKAAAKQSRELSRLPQRAVGGPGTILATAAAPVVSGHFRKTADAIATTARGALSQAIEGKMVSPSGAVEKELKSWLSTLAVNCGKDPQKVKMDKLMGLAKDIGVSAAVHNNIAAEKAVPTTVVNTLRATAAGLNRGDSLRRAYEGGISVVRERLHGAAEGMISLAEGERAMSLELIEATDKMAHFLHTDIMDVVDKEIGVVSAATTAEKNMVGWRLGDWAVRGGIGIWNTAAARKTLKSKNATKLQKTTAVMGAMAGWVPAALSLPSVSGWAKENPMVAIPATIASSVIAFGANKAASRGR